MSEAVTGTVLPHETLTVDARQPDGGQVAAPLSPLTARVKASSTEHASESSPQSLPQIVRRSAFEPTASHAEAIGTSLLPLSIWSPYGHWTVPPQATVTLAMNTTTMSFKLGFMALTPSKR